MLKGGDARGHAEDVHIAGHARADAAVFLAQGGVRNDGKGTGEPGDVVGFAHRHQGDGAVARIVIQAGKGTVACAIEDDVAVDFIRADEQVVFFGDGVVTGEFGIGIGAANRVVRVAEQQQAGLVVDVGFKRIEVGHPAAVFEYAG